MEHAKEWKSALRLQIEALAKRNELHRSRSNNESVKYRTQEMSSMIVKLRELLTTNSNAAAPFYLQCVCHADETERILNRTSSREKKRGKNKVSITNETPVLHPITNGSSRSAVVVELAPDANVAFAADATAARGKWWNHFNIHRRFDEYSEGRNERRDLWRSQKDFFVSCLGFMIGVGNIMRFPAKVYQYGGGVFFIPYFCCLVLFGLPIVYLHLAIGQFSGLTASAAFKKLMPGASGLGYALTFVAIPIAIYYNTVVAWAIYYFYHSVAGFIDPNGLPWESCENSWDVGYDCCELHNLSTCYHNNIPINQTITAAEAFFYFDVLALENFRDTSLGPLQGHLVVCLAIAWILVFLGVCKGIGSIGCSMNTTATVPYLLLLILLLRGLSLPGSDIGLRFLFSAELHRLADYKIWRAAATQVFYELGIDAGPLISMAAFSRFRNNVYRDAALLVFIDAVTSVLAAMVIFSFVGFLAFVSDRNVNQVLHNDPMYLSFTVYPGVTSFMYFGPLWASLFFATLICAAIDAEFAWLEMIVSSIMDNLSSKNKSLENKLLFLLCCAGFVFGLPLCTKGGVVVYHALENLSTTYTSFLLVIWMLIVVCYGYGADKFLIDIGMMLRSKFHYEGLKHLSAREKLHAIFGPSGYYIQFCWAWFGPIVLGMLLITSILDYSRIRFAGVIIPIEYELSAWIILTIPMAAIPYCLLREAFVARRTGKVLTSLLDSSQWGDNVEFGVSDRATRRTRLKSRRNGGTIRGRENTYMYIEAVSRGPTVRNISMEECYGWRTGRLRDWRMSDDEQSTQNAVQSPQQSFSQSMASQATSGPVPLFGAPPLDHSVNAFAISNALTIRRNSTKRRMSSDSDEFPLAEIREIAKRTRRKPCLSEPPVKLSTISEPPKLPLPSPPAPRISPCRSEPPLLRTDRPVLSPRHSQRSQSECLTDTDDDDGIEMQRNTVIRRLRRESQSSSIADSTAPSFASTTPVDLPRQRSLSSVAIFDERGSRPPQTLSQLKRPAPIDAPIRKD